RSWLITAWEHSKYTFSSGSAFQLGMPNRLLETKKARNQGAEHGSVKHLLEVLQAFVDSAVHKNRLSSNVRCAIGSQPYNCVSDFFWFPQASQWRFRSPRFKNVCFSSSRGRRTASCQFLKPVCSCVTRRHIIH